MILVAAGYLGKQLFSLPQLGYKNQLAAIIIGDMTGEVQPAHLSGGLRWNRASEPTDYSPDHFFTHSTDRGTND